MFWLLKHLLKRSQHEVESVCVHLMIETIFIISGFFGGKEIFNEIYF